MLQQELASKLQGHVVVIGVGDASHGDDGAGPMVVKLLAGLGVRDVLDSGPTPELDTWKLRKMKPDTVLFVDAVDFGGAPGDSAILSPDDLRSTGFDTHRAPLQLTMKYIEHDLKCKCFLLAIEPKDVGQGTSMCDEVRDSGTRLANILRSILSGPAKTCDGERILIADAQPVQNSDTPEADGVHLRIQS